MNQSKNPSIHIMSYDSLHQRTFTQPLKDFKNLSMQISGFSLPEQFEHQVRRDSNVVIINDQLLASARQLHLLCFPQTLNIDERSPNVSSAKRRSSPFFLLLRLVFRFIQIILLSSSGKHSICKRFMISVQNKCLIIIIIWIPA